MDRHADGMAVSVDARNGFVAAAGWQETTNVRAAKLVQELAIMGVPTVTYTNVSIDGTLQGVDLVSLEEVARSFGGDVIYAGGVGSLDDIRAVARLRHRRIPRVDDDARVVGERREAPVVLEPRQEQSPLGQEEEGGGVRDARAGLIPWE